MPIKIKRLHPEAVLPAYKTEGAAALDLTALETTIVSATHVTAVRTGLAIQIPSGYVGLVSLRSSTSINTPLLVVNAPGIIDSDYRGEIMVLVSLRGERFERGEHDAYYPESRRFVLHKGERFAQLTIVPAPQFTVTEVDELDDTARGTGGFGSTGAS